MKKNYYYINSEPIIESFLDMTKGKTGKKGDQGIIGHTGDIGLKGLKGPVGFQGRQGDPGAKGDRGLKGNIGLQGDEGNTGDRGEKGIKGPPGPKGDRGPEGDKGDRGVRGTSGEKGKPGKQGEKGGKGESGFSFSNISTEIKKGCDKKVTIKHSNKIKVYQQENSCPPTYAISGIKTFAWTSRIKEYRKTQSCSYRFMAPPECTTTTVTWAYRGWQVGREYELCCTKMPFSLKRAPPTSVKVDKIVFNKKIPAKYQEVSTDRANNIGENLDNQKDFSREKLKKYPFHKP